MNKSLTVLAGAAVLLVGLPAGMLPQAKAASGTFADVPADHWAYEAVDTLQKAGIVIGYPDGSYGGRRAMTRYEFAEAIARLLPLLNTDTSNFATKDELAAAQADLQNKLDANTAAIDALQQLVNGFEPELTALGVDVAAIKARLDSLEARVAAIEAEQARVHITGDVNIIGRANMISKNDFAIDQNGSAIERDSDTNAAFPGEANNRLFQADDVYNDFLLGIRGKLDEQSTANVLIDFGNYLDNVGNVVAPGSVPGNAFTSFGTRPLITPGLATPGNQQTTIWEAYLATPTGYGPLGQGTLEAGRLPIQWTKYTLKAVDSDVYTDLYQTKSGNIPVDGAKLDGKTGSVGWDAWAGKFSAIPFAQPFLGTSTYGIDYGPNNEIVRPHFGLEVSGQQELESGLNPADHAEAVDQGAGFRANWGKAGIDIAQYALNIALQDPDTDTHAKPYNRVTVAGADYDGPIPFINSHTLGLEISETGSFLADGSGFDNVNHGWRDIQSEEQLKFNLGSVGLEGGYRYIGPNFMTPGYWGAIGSWINPNNVEGPVASLTWGKGTGFTVNADYEDYQAAYGATKDNEPLDNPLQQGDRVQRYQVGVGKQISQRDNLSVSYEDDLFDLKDRGDSDVNSGHPDQNFLTFGLDHRINRNAQFKLIYQVFDYNDDGTGFIEGDGFESNDVGGRSQGETAEGQFSLHF
jgi:hypothetical protein